MLVEPPTVDHTKSILVFVAKEAYPTGVIYVCNPSDSILSTVMLPKQGRRIREKDEESATLSTHYQQSAAAAAQAIITMIHLREFVSDISLRKAVRVYPLLLFGCT